MIVTPDGIALYTQEDYDTTSNTHFQEGIRTGRLSESASLRDKAIEFFKSEAESTMTKEDALDFFNALASALGWDTVDNLTKTWTVKVEYLNTTIGEFSGIEADDEDSAIEEVQGNLLLESAELELSVSYNGDTAYESVDMSYHFDTSDLEFSAEAED